MQANKLSLKKPRKAIHQLLNQNPLKPIKTITKGEVYMPTYFEQINFLYDACLQIASLKKERRILLCEILIISKELTVLENRFNYVRKNTDKKFSQNFSVTENIKELTLLIKKYKKLILLFRKYTKQLVEIELEIISIKSSTSSFESVSQ